MKEDKSIVRQSGKFTLLMPAAIFLECIMEYRQPFYGEYPITQKYGEVIDGVTVGGKPHTGIDYACPVGTPILASESGTVIFSGWDTTGYGNCVIIRHDDDQATVYAHLDQIPKGIYVGAKVNKGQVIGYSGYTGNVVPEGPAGAHLHFEARKHWNNFKSHFDPMDLPLHCEYDAPTPAPLKEADAFHPDEIVQVVCPLGAKAWYRGFGGYTTFCKGTKLLFTGNTVQHNGYTYMECVPLTYSLYVAVNDGDTQILDNGE